MEAHKKDNARIMKENVDLITEKAVFSANRRQTAERDILKREKIAANRSNCYKYWCLLMIQHQYL